MYEIVMHQTLDRDVVKETLGMYLPKEISDPIADSGVTMDMLFGRI